MNFFEYQDKAYQNTKKLIGLFCLSILLMSVIIYGLLFRLFPKIFGTTFNLKHLGLVACYTIIFIALGSLYKMLRLRKGGGVIAEELGGELLSHEIANQQEKQLLNVVEEMAIASGIPVPDVYLLNKETGINAFAAGFTPNEAVIAVTKGTLEHLTRDELQAVIGHEFSHIFNGDMRLNLYLVVVLHGILCIYLLGSQLWTSWQYDSTYGDRENTGGLIFLAFVVGIPLMIIGSIGLICGRIIKATISRQREFLADASSVQFTRNPDGLAGALLKLQNVDSRLYSPGAEAASHMFFSNGINLSYWGSVFYTHPSLAQRISRIVRLNGGNAGTITLEESVNVKSYSESLMIGITGGNHEVLESIPAEHLALEQALLSHLPESLSLSLQDSSSLVAMVFALALDSKNIDRQEKQIAWLEEIRSSKLARNVLKLSKEISQLDSNIYIGFVDMTVLTLRQYAPHECFNLSEDIQGFIAVEESNTLSSLMLMLIVSHRLAPSITTVKFSLIEEIWTDALLVLSALAQVGDSIDDEIAYFFRSGVFRLPGAIRQEKPETPLSYDVSTFKKSLELITFASAKLKQGLVDAGAYMVLLDHQFNTYEADLLRTIAITLNCSVPPFLNTQNSFLKSR